MSDAIAPSTSTPATAEPPRPTAAEVLHLATAYQASRALHVAIRLGLPEPAGRGAATGRGPRPRDGLACPFAPASPAGAGVLYQVPEGVTRLGLVGLRQV